MRPICLDHLSLVDLGATELVRLAADLGFARASLFVTPIPIGPATDFTLDRAARSDLLAALRETGVGVGIVEPFMLDKAPDWDLMERTAALAAEIGGTVNVLGFDADRVRLQDSLGRLADMARRAGADMTIEAYPLSRIRDLREALDLAVLAGPDVGLCIDTLHVIRSGGGWADVAALPAARIRHVQINDGPLEPPADRVAESIRTRTPPGDGAFDLPSLLPYVPDHAVLAVEAPFEAPGLSAMERGRILMDAARRLLKS